MFVKGKSEKIKTTVMEGLNGWASYISTTGQLINNVCCKVCEIFALKLKAIKKTVESVHLSCLGCFSFAL